ncbi:hypothetical protein ACFLYT_02005, partial [Nanoarchaeota archaeon]
AVQPVSFENINIDLLAKYSYGQKLELKIIKTIEELDEQFPLIANHTLSNYKPIKTNNLVLRPLITFTDEEIQDKLEQLK